MGGSAGRVQPSRVQHDAVLRSTKGHFQMRMKVLAMAAAVAGSMGLASAASAAPIAVPSADAVAGGAQVTTVAYGCGPGFAPGRFGYCRPIFRPYHYSCIFLLRCAC
jgi:hypothetical protein